MCYKVKVQYNMLGSYPLKMQMALHPEFNRVCKDMRFTWIVDPSFIDDAKEDWPYNINAKCMQWRCFTDAHAHGWIDVMINIISIKVYTMKGELIWEFQY